MSQYSVVILNLVLHCCRLSQLLELGVRKLIQDNLSFSGFWARAHLERYLGAWKLFLVATFFIQGFSGEENSRERCRNLVCDEGSEESNTEGLVSEHWHWFLVYPLYCSQGSRENETGEKYISWSKPSVHSKTTVCLSGMRLHFASNYFFSPRNYCPDRG